jgi:hypothetical protein
MPSEKHNISSLLLDEQPLVVLPKLAVLIGLNESIVIQQLHYWIQKNLDKQDHIKDGRVWCWNTYEEWRVNNFPWWSDATIKRAFQSLVEIGIVIKDRHNKRSFDRTGWYTIDYDALAQYVSNRVGQNDLIEQINPDDRAGQNDPLQGGKVTSSSGQNDGTIPETTTETNTETISDGASPRPRARDLLFDAICEVCRVDAKTAGASVGKVKTNLVKAGYMADDVIKFGAWWWADEFRKRRNTPPTLWQLVERIGIVKGGAANGQTAGAGKCPVIGAVVMTPAEVAAQRAIERSNAQGGGNGNH